MSTALYQQSPTHDHHLSDDDEDIEDDGESHSCRRCDLPISEGHAYELGGDRWHMYCFSCSKCSKLLGTSSNFLVLGTGDLICSDCSYACNACGKKIDDLAILTGDQAYCSSCFCCRNCKKRIEDLRYARTSKGLFCMSCHEKLLEKKKRHEQEKKLKLLQQQQSQSSSQSNRVSKYYNGDKSLPKIPQSTAVPVDQSGNIPNRVASPASSGSDMSTPGVYDAHNTNTIATISRTSPISTPIIPQRSPQRSTKVTSHTPTLEPPPDVLSTNSSPFIISDESFNDNKENDNNNINLSIGTPKRSLNGATSPLRSTIVKTPNGDRNRKAHVVDNISSSSSSNILSSYINSSPPPKISPPKAPILTGNVTASASAATVVHEGDDFIDMNDSEEDDSKNIINDYAQGMGDDTDIQKYTQQPSGFGEYRGTENVPSGLNIKGLDETPSEFLTGSAVTANEYSDTEDDFIKTPNDSKTSPWKFGGSKILSPLSPSPNKEGKNEALSRVRSMRSPKHFFSRSSKHKKTDSASSTDNYKISSPVIIQSNAYSEDGGNGNKGVTDNDKLLSTPGLHHRKGSDLPIITSPLQQGAAVFSTPPVPGNSNRVSHSHHGSSHYQSLGSASHQRSYSASSQQQHHTRSISDVNTVERNTGLELKQYELELRSVKIEIRDLKQTKHGILKEITELSTTRDNLRMEINSMLSKVEELKMEAAETTKKNSYESKSSHSLQPPQQISSSQSVKQISSHDTQLQQQQPQLQPSQDEKSGEHSPELAEAKLVQTKPKAKFWKRGLFHKQDQVSSNAGGNSGNLSGSQSSYSLSNILNTGSNDKTGNPSISHPLLKTEELDELGGNDNKKLITPGISNGQSSIGKYLDVGSASSSTALSSTNNSSAFIMSDLFNSTLESRAIYEKRSMPLIITRLVIEVEMRGLDSEGIYRKNGATSQMNAILKNFNALLTKETSLELENSIAQVDINAITSSLKRYLYYHLPEPVITNNVYDEFIEVSNLSSKEEKIEELVNLLNRLPKTNLKVLRFLMAHLSRIESHKAQNKMNYHNLSVVFGPTLIRSTDGEKELKDMNQRNLVMEFLLINNFEIFGKIKV